MTALSIREQRQFSAHRKGDLSGRTAAIGGKSFAKSANVASVAASNLELYPAGVQGRPGGHLKYSRNC